MALAQGGLACGQQGPCQEWAVMGYRAGGMGRLTAGMEWEGPMVHPPMGTALTRVQMGKGTNVGECPSHMGGRGLGSSG